MRVGEISETDLLARIIPRLPRGRTTLVGPGDDAAVLAGSAAPQVVTTDVLVQDRHFRLGWGTGADLGWRAAMQNLADVAAMGAVPNSLVMALVLPGHVPVRWVEDLAEGFAQACAPHHVGVVGGDLTSGEQIAIAVTALGVIDDGEPVLRSGARPGDVIAVSGVLGHARAGLALLEAERAEPADLVGAFLRPTPPLSAGPVAARAGAHALMDISDGLARDAGRIAVASGVLVDLDPAALAADIAALDPVAAQVGADATAWVLGGGEDHGALATFAPAAAGARGSSSAPAVRTPSAHPRGEGAAPSSALPEQFRPIGRVHAVPPGLAPGVRWGGADLPPGTEGWDHFGR
ncbi:thiamine-phosphate kinase [Pseudactinotalea sp. Z1732]|uniref:thiamine-phosphate kinase n=1 Tax=Pseudactinotalea sp. Z1732 TaxID=3413026 RepID=UPI003C7D60E8